MRSTLSDISSRAADDPCVGSEAEPSGSRKLGHAWLGKASAIISPIAVAVAENNISGPLGAGVIALAGVVTAAYWIRRMDDRAGIPRNAPWIFVGSAFFAVIVAAFTPGQISRASAVVAAILTMGTVLIARERESAARLLIGMAAIAVGVSEITAGVAYMGRDQTAVVVSDSAMGAAFVVAGVTVIAGRAALVKVAVIGVGAIAGAHGTTRIVQDSVAGGLAQIAVGAGLITAWLSYGTGRRMHAGVGAGTAGVVIIAVGATDIVHGRSIFVSTGIVYSLIGAVFIMAGAAAIIGGYRIRAKLALIAGRRQEFGRTAVVVSGLAVFMAGITVIMVGLVFTGFGVEVAIGEKPGFATGVEGALGGAGLTVAGLAVLVIGLAGVAAGVALLTGRGWMLARAQSAAAGGTAIAAGATIVAYGLAYAAVGASAVTGRGYSDLIRKLVVAAGGRMQAENWLLPPGAVAIVAGATILGMGVAIVMGRRSVTVVVDRRILTGAAAMMIGVLNVAYGVVDVSNARILGSILSFAVGVMIFAAGVQFIAGRRAVAGVAAMLSGAIYAAVGIIIAAGSQALVGISHSANVQVLNGVKDVVVGVAYIAVGALAVDFRYVVERAQRIIKWATEPPSE